MKTKHTSAPWIINCTDAAHEKSPTMWPIENKDGKEIALVCHSNKSLPYSEQEANVKLIAVAPELLEALEILHCQIDNDLIVNPERYEQWENLMRGLKLAKEAIKKAKV